MPVTDNESASMTMGGGFGLRSTHPSALNPDWSLRYGKPLITPRRAPENICPTFSIVA